MFCDTVGSSCMLCFHSIIYLIILWGDCGNQLLLLKLSIYLNVEDIIGERALCRNHCQYYLYKYMCSGINQLLFKNHCSKAVRGNDLSNIGMIYVRYNFW